MNAQAYELVAGSLGNMQLKDKTIAAPAPHEVSIAVKAIGLNFADVFAIWGLYGATPEGNFIPGLEFSGEVVAIGSEVKELKIGERVMGVTRFGAYTTALNIDQSYVIPIPEDWSYEEGASYLVQVLTAYYGLKFLGNIQEGQNVLIHSAAGGVGIWANRIAKQYGAFTVGTVGNPAKLALLEEEGYDQGMVRSRKFKRDLDEALDGRDLHIVMECIGGHIFKTSYNRLAPQGRVVVYGSARYASVGKRPNYLKLIFHYLTRPMIDPQKIIEENKALMGFNLIWLYQQADLMHSLLKELADFQMPKPLVGHLYDFKDLKDAVLMFQSGKTIGKVVIKI
jgi:alcohol dehydrogenase